MLFRSQRAMVAVDSGPHQVDGKILAISRRGNPDDLNLPGKKVDPGEILMQALFREVEEETGIRIFSMSRVYRGPCEGPVTYDTTTFLADYWLCDGLVRARVWR